MSLAIIISKTKYYITDFTNRTDFAEQEPGEDSIAYIETPSDFESTQEGSQYPDVSFAWNYSRATLAEIART